MGKVDTPGRPGAWVEGGVVSPQGDQGPGWWGGLSREARGLGRWGLLSSQGAPVQAPAHPELLLWG